MSCLFIGCLRNAQCIFFTINQTDHFRSCQSCCYPEEQWNKTSLYTDDIILYITKPNSTISYLKRVCEFKWSKEGIKYLGTFIPIHLDHLFGKNYNKNYSAYQQWFRAVVYSPPVSVRSSWIYPYECWSNPTLFISDDTSWNPKDNVW